MSRGGQDTEYKPIAGIVRTSRSSRRRRHIQQMDYSEKETKSDNEIEATNSSESTLVVYSPDRRESQVKGETEWDLENLWTPWTLETRTKLVSEQYFRLTEKRAERAMAETNNLEKVIEMMLKLRQEDKREEREREVGGNRDKCNC